MIAIQILEIQIKSSFFFFPSFFFFLFAYKIQPGFDIETATHYDANEQEFYKKLIICALGHENSTY